MNSIPEQPRAVCGFSLESGGAEYSKACDRVLLYLRGMDLPPVAVLELALECMAHVEQHAPDMTDTVDGTGEAGEADMAGRKDHADQPGPVPVAVLAMRHLHALLRERGICFQILTPEGEILRSTPPLNRRSMVAEEMERSPFRRILKRLGGKA